MGCRDAIKFCLVWIKLIKEKKEGNIGVEKWVVRGSLDFIYYVLVWD